MYLYLVFLAFLSDFSRIQKNIFLGEFWRRRMMKNYVCKTVGIFSIKDSIELFSVFFLPVFYHLPKVFVFN